MTYDATINRILRRVIPGVHVDRTVLDALIREKPTPAGLVSLLAAPDPSAVRAAVLYLGMYGTMRESAVLALCLHHEDAGVVQLAEHCLWSLWMQAGSADGNRRLASGIGYLETGDSRAAVRTFDALVAAEPDFAEAHFQRGLALSMMERVEEAEQAIPAGAAAESVPLRCGGGSGACLCGARQPARGAALLPAGAAHPSATRGRAGRAA